MKPLIFYVDDESMNLTVFEAALPPDWDIATFDNPTAALQEMQKRAPWVIVSDQRMPGMKGVDFLDKARQICPNAIRIIATGFSDEQLIIESVRRAKISDYIRKPWDPDELASRLQMAIDQYQENSRPMAASAPKNVEAIANQDLGAICSRFGLSTFDFDVTSGKCLINGSPVDSTTLDPDEWEQLADLQKSPNTPRIAVLRSTSTDRRQKWQLFIADAASEPNPEKIRGAVIDVTSLKESEDKLMRHTLEVSKSNEFLGEYANHLSNAASDPLRNLLNYLDLMKVNPSFDADPSLRDLMQRTRECADTLKLAMQTILRLSRVSFSKLELDSINLKAILVKLVEQEVIDRKFDLQVTMTTYPTVWGDEKMLSQLFANLIHSISWNNDFANRSVQITNDQEMIENCVIMRFEGVAVSLEQLASAFNVNTYSTPSALDCSKLILARTIMQRMGGDLTLDLATDKCLVARLSFARAISSHSKSRLRLVA